MLERQALRGDGRIKAWAMAGCISRTAARGAGGPAFDLVMSKLRRPQVRPGTVRRSLLIERLARGIRALLSR
jgi:hypothetical protein